MLIEFAFLCCGDEMVLKSSNEPLPNAQTYSFKLQSLDDSQFPIAFRARTLCSADIASDEYYQFEKIKVYRTFNNKIFILNRIYPKTEKLKEEVKERIYRKNRISDIATKKHIVSNIQSYLNSYVILNENELWQETREPMYAVVEDSYIRYRGNGVSIIVASSSLPPQPYCFNALQEQEAIAYCVEKANNLNTGIGECVHIEVLIPEMVQCDPQAEYIVAQLSK